MSIYGYVRVSTGMQAESGLSLEEQRRQIEAYAEAHRLGPVEAFFTERAVSGGLELAKRPRGAELLDRLQTGDTVICSKLDRMFRSARDALNTVKHFESRKIALHFIDLGGDVSTNGVAKLFFTIMGAVAEFERNRISERQRDAKAQAKAEGRYTGGKRKFGYQVKLVDGRKRLVPDETEQAIIAFVNENRAMKLRALQAAILARYDRCVSLATLSRIGSCRRQ